MIYGIMVVVKFLVFVSEVVSIFSKILTWIIGGQKDTFAPPTQLLGGRVPRLPPKSTPMPMSHALKMYFPPIMRYHDSQQVHDRRFTTKGSRQKIHRHRVEIKGGLMTNFSARG